MDQFVTVRLVVDVTYNLNGGNVETVKQSALDAMQRSLGDGMLAGAGVEEVESWNARTVVVPELLSEDAITQYFHDRTVSGNLHAHYVPGALASYGLMDPAEFIDEMAERMGLEIKPAASLVHCTVYDSAEGKLHVNVSARNHDEAYEEAGIAAAENGCRAVKEITVGAFE